MLASFDLVLELTNLVGQLCRRAHDARKDVGHGLLRAGHLGGHALLCREDGAERVGELLLCLWLLEERNELGAERGLGAVGCELG